MPKYIVIENLEIRSSHPDYQFTDDSGNTVAYSSAASSVYVEKGENITVRNCKMHDSANGFFVASSDDTVSRNILVEGNYILGNGISGSAFQHNNYTAAIGITFQYNRFGPLRAGAVGNALKDRFRGFFSTLLKTWSCEESCGAGRARARFIGSPYSLPGIFPW